MGIDWKFDFHRKSSMASSYKTVLNALFYKHKKNEKENLTHIDSIIIYLFLKQCEQYILLFIYWWSVGLTVIRGIWLKIWILVVLLWCTFVNKLTIKVPVVLILELLSTVPCTIKCTPFYYAVLWILQISVTLDSKLCMWSSFHVDLSN